MYKPKIMYKSFTQEIADQNSEGEELLKVNYKRFTQNKIQYYANGPYAGKKVGSIRGTGTKLPPTKKEPVYLRDGVSFSTLDPRAQNFAIINAMNEMPEGINRPSMEEVRAKLMTSHAFFNRTGIKLDSE